MPPDLRIEDGVIRKAAVGFRLDDEDMSAPEGETLAAALFASGVRTLRRCPQDGSPRGAFCFMGICQECAVLVDGRVVEACRVAVADGLEVRRL
jgi:sarcosine oxidase subunit alpha